MSFSLNYGVKIVSVTLAKAIEKIGSIIFVFNFVETAKRGIACYLKILQFFVATASNHTN